MQLDSLECAIERQLRRGCIRRRRRASEPSIYSSCLSTPETRRVWAAFVHTISCLPDIFPSYIICLLPSSIRVSASSYSYAFIVSTQDTSFEPEKSKEDLRYVAIMSGRGLRLTNRRWRQPSASTYPSSGRDSAGPAIMACKCSPEPSASRHFPPCLPNPTLFAQASVF